MKTRDIVEYFDMVNAKQRKWSITKESRKRRSYNLGSETHGWKFRLYKIFPSKKKLVFV